MRIDVIDRMEDLLALADNWRAVYAADPEAQVFLSHEWQTAWLGLYLSPWVVLAARPEEGGDYVAFLPLRLRARFEDGRGFTGQLILSGDEFSDYNGLLCRPEHEAAAVPALAHHLRDQLDWAELRLDNLRMSPARLRLLLGAFDSLKFKRRKIPGAPDVVDNDVCPYVDLPDDWDAYLASLGASTRQKARRLLRKVEDSDAFSITVASADTVERDLSVLLGFWRARWAASKAERTESIIARNFAMLTRFAEDGLLFLPVLWRAGEPVAALATVIDPAKKRFHFVITGRDEAFTDIPPGFVLHAFSIREAIARGMRTYDFLRGDEPYKYLFTSKDHPIQTLILSAPARRKAGGGLDARALPSMIDQARSFLVDEAWPKAEAACRQILERDPDNALTLHQLGLALAGLGRHGAAGDAFARSVELAPEGDNAWLGLAGSREATGDLHGALEAARTALDLAPGNTAAREMLARLRPAAFRPRSEPADPIAMAVRATAAQAHAAFDPGPRIRLDLPGLTVPPA